MNFNQAIEGLEGFDRIWVIYIFHLNENWKPKVHPPRIFIKK
jgi:tRNA (Thr-GGU) A37 N-methylase